MIEIFVGTSKGSEYRSFTAWTGPFMSRWVVLCLGEMNVVKFIP